jgi:nitroimidazol reductase NimA-like FMN-containing flavoprotein (pyridoxamine 5'-phosphate oxidase superfamily)
VIGPLPSDARAVLERGAFCSLAATTRHGPHVTPTVFVLADDRVWVTTSRGSVKARAWRLEPAVAGLVRSDDVAVVFTGSVRTFDLLEVDSWVRDLLEAPALTVAATRFTRKNARFFAGYAVDARHVPLSWTPPGRVFTAIEIERLAIVGPGGVAETFGEWPRGLVSIARFRAARTVPPVLEALPEDVRGPLGDSGEGALALEGDGGPVVLPVSWVTDGGSLYAATSRETLGLASLSQTRVRAALAIDRSSWWRARNMTGAMLRGSGEVAIAEALVSGAASATRVARASGAERGAAVVRLRAEQLVWWRGWSSGTVAVA